MWSRIDCERAKQDRTPHAETKDQSLYDVASFRRDEYRKYVTDMWNPTYLQRRLRDKDIFAYNDKL